MNSTAAWTPFPLEGLFRRTLAFAPRLPSDRKNPNGLRGPTCYRPTSRPGLRSAPLPAACLRILYSRERVMRATGPAH